jgi:hypothetical protein
MADDVKTWAHEDDCLVGCVIKVHRPSRDIGCLHQQGESKSCAKNWVEMGTGRTQYNFGLTQYNFGLTVQLWSDTVQLRSNTVQLWSDEWRRRRRELFIDSYLLNFLKIKRKLERTAIYFTYFIPLSSLKVHKDKLKTLSSFFFIDSFLYLELTFEGTTQTVTVSVYQTVSYEYMKYIQYTSRILLLSNAFVQQNVFYLKRKKKAVPFQTYMCRGWEL